MKETNTQPYQIPALVPDRLSVVPPLERQTDQTYPAFEYKDRGQRVEVLKQGLVSAFGIDNPRFDSFDVFDITRFEETLEIHEDDREVMRLKSRGVMRNNNLPTVMPEYYSDVTEEIVQTITLAKQMGIPFSQTDAEEAIIDFSVKAAFQMKKSQPDKPIFERLRQFVINTQQRIQIDVFSERPASFHDGLTGRHFDEELDILEKSAPESLTPSDPKFMRETNPQRMENVMLVKLESMLTDENIQGFQTVRKAQRLSKQYHEGQSHLGLVDYPVHLNRVALRIMEDPYFSDKPEELIKALTLTQLHDILEDTYCPPETIQELFGDEMLYEAERLSKFKRVDFDPHKPIDLASYYSNLACQPAWVRYVKGYDRVDNWYASHMKVESEIEDKIQAIQAQDLYLKETQRYYEGLVSDNPTLVLELQKAVHRL